MRCDVSWGAGGACGFGGGFWGVGGGCAGFDMGDVGLNERARIFFPILIRPCMGRKHTKAKEKET